VEHLADTLVALGGAFVVCGLVARAAARGRLPTIPLFMLAGVLLGPHTPGFVLVSDPGDLALVARLGLVFLLLYLGLEFSLRDLTSGGARLAAAAAAYLVLNVGAGLGFGVALGWGTREALLVAGIVGISSSAIVTKILVDNRRLANPETRVILGVIVIEDLFLAAYLALLQPVLVGAGSVTEALSGAGVAFAFLLGLSLVARYGVTAVSRLLGTKDDEVVVVLTVGLAILGAGVAEQFRVSDAIGAFMVGVILAGAPSAGRLRTAVHPLRDAFGALFFFHFGLTIAPGRVGEVLGPVLAGAALTVVLCLAAGVVAARIHGYDRAQAAAIGLTVLPRGEFSLVLATLALAAGLDQRLASFAAGYVLVLAVIGPLAATRSGSLARVLPRRWFPRPRRCDDVPASLDMDIGTSQLYQLGTDLLQIKVEPGSRLHGVSVQELRLPAGAVLGILARDGVVSPVSPSTVLRTGDVLVVLTTPDARQAVEERVLAVHRAGRLARWHGERGA
jgi:CPA2 family monovalent cation:H+ antiporter-2